MLDFEKLVNGRPRKKDEIEQYFLNFFTKNNFKDYQIPLSANEDSIKAIRTMFESKRKLSDRVDRAFSYDPFCLEAFYVYYVTTENVFVNYRCKSYYEQISGYGDLGAYHKYCFMRILEFYSDFLMSIRNFTKGIKVERSIIRLSNTTQGNHIDRLSFLYASLENADDFYRLYVEADSFSVYAYILLILTLLKHDDQLKAKEVAQDMFEHIEYSSYIDHLWDLDMNDPGQKEFYKAVELCGEEINAVPDFFTFMNIVREKKELRL